MCEGLPVDIAPEEIIVRALKTPVHYDERKKRVKPSAFRAQAGKDDVSVMRKRHLGNDGCKRKAIEIARDAYVGMAALTAQEIVAAQARVVDSREGQFLGHAHIEQGMTAPASGQPAPPELMERYKELADKARFYDDGEPQNPQWVGADIL
ncbi:hypothetical protein [Rudaea sp.]|uniref:hypothetical protein n=1 Tax=Rudaea sp. TaxID=2136325 RepID=UPI003784CF2F